MEIWVAASLAPVGTRDMLKPPGARGLDFANFSRRYIGEAAARTAAGVGGEVKDAGVGVWTEFAAAEAVALERGVGFEVGCRGRGVDAGVAIA